MRSDDLKAQPSSHPAGSPDESGYPGFLERLQTAFEGHLAHQRLFTTDAAGLWEAYLAALPEEARQEYACSACRRFVERFGSLVSIDGQGLQRSVFWDERLATPALFAAVEQLRARVEKARVTGVFLSAQAVWGTPVKGDWTHMAVRVPPAHVFRPSLLDAHQRMAELREHSRCLNVALGEFPTDLLKQAHSILQAEALSRSEKFIGVVEWLLARQEERKQPQGHNLLWKAVASAPAGFCTPRASMVGTLLEDLSAGLPFETVQARFNAKMHPLQYQRPQAAPSAGNVEQAEAAIAKLGLAPALERRFATLADVPLTWKPAADKAVSNRGIFGHLRTKEERSRELHLPGKTLTWVKFRDTVLPTAERIQLRVPSSSPAFSALVTAVHADAPPLLQWDSLEQRNPVSWYFYPNGSTASSWGLKPGEVEVLGVTMKPNTWFNERFAHQGQGVFFVLKGARDSRNSSLALFPEILRGELHGIRATLEAFSQSRQLNVPEGQPLASGMMFTSGGNGSWEVVLSVASQGAVTTYTLDRWD
jgi:hypothetical protein